MAHVEWLDLAGVGECVSGDTIDDDDDLEKEGVYKRRDMERMRMKHIALYTSSSKHMVSIDSCYHVCAFLVQMTLYYKFPW